MLEELIEACSGVISPSTNVVLLADSSYSELHRWTARPSSSTSPLPVYSFTHNVVEMHRTLSTLLHKSSSNSGGKRMRLVLAVMQIDVEVLTVMQYVLSYLHQLQGCNEEEEQILDECIIFTTTHPSTIMANADLCGLLREDGGEEEDGFGLLARYLRDCGGGQDRPSTFPIRVFYTPCQALSLIPSLQSNQQDEVEEKSTDIEVRVLTSHRHRSLQPLTLSRLMRSHHFARKAEHQSIYDVAAADLPSEVRQDLKSFTSDLAAVLLHQLHLDPSAAIYAMGKTASLIGHNLLPCLEALKQSSQEDFNLSTSEAKIHLDSYESASLILIDRLEDLFTPATYAVSATSSVSPLAHRILNAVKVQVRPQQAWVELDIPLSFPIFHAVEDIWDEDSADTSSALLHPMAAVSNLAYQTTPSIRHSLHEGYEHLLPLYHALYLSSEEQCRQVLSDFFKDLLPKEKALSGKKKGFGVEMLSHVQLLTEHCQSSANQSTHHYDKLFSLAMAIIEALQRSNAKQFASICSYKTSIDTRSSRDNELLASITSSSSHVDNDDDIEVMASQIMKTFYTNQGSSSSSSGPVDLIHVLLQLLACLSLFRYRGISTSFLTECSGHIARYLLNPKLSDEELRHLQSLGVLSVMQVKSVLQYRELYQDSHEMKAKTSQEDFDSNNAYYQLIYELVSVEVMRPMQDLCMMYNHSAAHGHQAVASSGSGSPLGQKGKDELRHKLWQSTYHLLNKSQTNTFDSLSDHGLLSRVVLDCIACHENFSDADLTSLLSLLEHIETPLQKMTRTGLDFLSKGFGRFGFGGSSPAASNLPPHPGKEHVLVLGVVGGITYREIAQLKRNLSFIEQQHGHVSNDQNRFRLVVVSNNIINAEDVLTTIFS